MRDEIKAILTGVFVACLNQILSAYFSVNQSTLDTAAIITLLSLIVYEIRYKK